MNMGQGGGGGAERAWGCYSLTIVKFMHLYVTLHSLHVAARIIYHHS